MEQPELNKCYVFNDERGKFAPLSLSYKGQGVLDKQWVQSNLSITMSKNTIRGLHFQNGKFAQSKLVKVVRGKVLDFIVDLRPESLHHMNVSFYDLDDSVELYVPRGFAHGFITLMDNTIVARPSSTLEFTHFVPKSIDEIGIKDTFYKLIDNFDGLTIFRKDQIFAAVCLLYQRFLPFVCDP